MILHITGLGPKEFGIGQALVGYQVEKVELTKEDLRILAQELESRTATLKLIEWLWNLERHMKR